MKIIVDRGGGVPESRQVREAVRHTIERGGLLPGDRLPTVRALAEQLDLAPNTVARAYRELEQEGWLVGRGRAGTFVADQLPDRPDGAEQALTKAAGTYARRAVQLGFDRAAALRALREAQLREGWPPGAS